ncbi:MAG: hypothetical protein HY006_03570 [Candidatus Sungbacteria bacterium]|nr:hypothetical protein [Candidatus Sungbacteria bacterium]
MLERTKKQIAYGTGAAVLVLAILSLATAGSVSVSPQAAPMPIEGHLPIILESLDIVQQPARPGIENSIDIAARLRNPNPISGTAKYPVIFTVKNRLGTEVKKVTVESYLLPGAIQYVMALNVGLGQEAVGSVDAIMPSQVSFSELPPDTQPPTFSAFARQHRDRQIGDSQIQDQFGIVKNTGTFAWEKVEVYVVGQSSEGKVVAVGKTFVGALKVGEEREFSVQWPRPVEAIDRILILPSTNMFAEDNITQTVGRPELLQ